MAETKKVLETTKAQLSAPELEKKAKRLNNKFTDQIVELEFRTAEILQEQIQAIKSSWTNRISKPEDVIERLLLMQQKYNQLDGVAQKGVDDLKSQMEAIKATAEEIIKVRMERMKVAKVATGLANIEEHSEDEKSS